MKNSLNQKTSEILKWELIQEDFKIKFGSDVFESWLKKMELKEINTDNLLISVPTRFIRDWITSRYLDNVIQVIKSHNKKINRIEFKINPSSKAIYSNGDIANKNNPNSSTEDANVTFIKDSFIQYNRIDPNRNFQNLPCSVSKRSILRRF